MALCSLSDNERLLQHFAQEFFCINYISSPLNFNPGIPYIPLLQHMYLIPSLVWSIKQCLLEHLRMLRNHVFLNLALPLLVTLQTCCLWNIGDEQADQAGMPAC